MSMFKKIVVTTKTKVGLPVEMHLSCRRYWAKGKRWTVAEHSIFGLEKMHSRVSAAEARKLKEAFLAKY